MIKHKVMKSEIVRISGIKVACPTERNAESFFCDAELSECICRPDSAHQATVVASLGYRNDPFTILNC